MVKKKSPKRSSKNQAPVISLRGCRQHNLKGFDLDIPLGKLTVVTGPSGSGKSSLAFHTLYAEGQRRYVETFSPYVRQFFDRMDKPKVDSIEGIPPAIAIEQKNHVRTTRSTVGTLTELNDYLKILFARLAKGFDPKTGELIELDSPESAAEWAMKELLEQEVLITFPLAIPLGAKTEELFPFLNAQGYLRVRIDGKTWRTDEPDSEALPRHLSASILIIQDRLKIAKAQRSRLLEALEAAFRLGKGHASVIHAEHSRAFSTAWTNPKTGFTLRAPTPSLFSFNSPLGACPKCRGFGRVIGIDLEKAVPDSSLSIKQGAIKPFQGERGEECQRDLLRCCRERGVDIDLPWSDLDEDEKEWIYYGESLSSTAEELEELWQSGQWYGIKGFFDWLETKAYKMHVRVFLSRYRSYTKCDSCRGKRLQPESLCFKINHQTLPDLWAMPIGDLLTWISELRLTETEGKSAADPTLVTILTEIHSRLFYLDQVGLAYLTLDRETRTLSGGEVERANLTTCLGASLTGTMFVLDEPSVGLHQRDIDRLIGVMHGLRDKGNTLIVVEHEETIMRAADHLIDVGPAAGQQGGNILYQGAISEGAEIPEHSSFEGTLPWLSGKRSIAVPEKRRKPSGEKLSIRGASIYHIDQLDVTIPLGLLVCLTGVSGSGKSTLAHDVIYQNIAKKLGKEIEGEAASIKELLGTNYLNGIELVDQTAVARTPRSTPAVFLGAFDAIRQLFCETESAKSAGLKPGFFSFNSGEGRCDRCSGSGVETVSMQFLSDLQVTCPDCEGRRYKSSTLDYTYEELSIADVLEMTASEAVERIFLDRSEHSKREARLIAEIQKTLAPLIEVGLGYLKLGQALNTLSGGESQRLKLCSLLSKTADCKKLLILDEPTTGLHFSDIENLLRIFQKLVDAGHSLCVIEHNFDVIKCADWIIDIGPEAGVHGGKIVAEGAPETVAESDTATAHYLRKALGQASSKPSLAEEKSISSVILPKTDMIHLEGARHHNLKNISVDIPRDQLVVISGLSGSGKSTLAFDILFAEGQRRFLDSMSAYARQFAEQLEKPEIDQLQGLPPTVAIEQRVSQGGGKSTVATVTEIWNFTRLLYAKLGTIHCPSCQVPVEKQSIAAIEKKIHTELEKGPIQILAPLLRGKKGYHTEIARWAAKQGFTKLLVDRRFCETEDFPALERFQEHDIDVVVAELSSKKGSNSQEFLREVLSRALDLGKGQIKIFTAEKKFLLLSTHHACPSCDRSFEELDPRLFSFNSSHGCCPECHGHGRMPKRRLSIDLSRYESQLEAEMERDRAIDRMEDVELIECRACKGSRLNEVGSAVQFHGMPISQLSQLSIDQSLDHFHALKLEDSRESLIARDILPEIQQRLNFLKEVGLGYLELNRSGNTLSGGESQRIRLAAQLGSNLRGVLYVLDEPTIGLHPRDNTALLKTLVSLKNQRNSVIIVEHDEDTISAADHLIDLGPGAGRLGGEIVYQGKPPTHQTQRSKTKFENSPTYRALTHPIQHPTRGSRRAIEKNHPYLKLSGCHANNLKHIDVAIPLHCLTVLTGVSGSGKSSLMRSCVAAVFQEKSKAKLPYKKVSGESTIKACFQVDQSPIGKTSRSCPATYVKMFDHIRALFAQLPEARMRGFDASRFSFNTEGGRCEHCKGNGRIKLEMDFLPSTWVLCEHCQGERYNSATLEVSFRGKTIAQVLSMTMDEAVLFFESQPRIAHPLKLMVDTGLGYLQLGQASPTLSGGEAQRIKLVSELIKGRSAKSLVSPVKNHNLYLIEEPTVGLHLEDIKRLIDVLHRLVEEGHTVLVIEHHMAVAAEADWILDIGPEAGELGGEIVVKGTPETVSQCEHSRTAPFLKLALKAGKSINS